MNILLPMASLKTPARRNPQRLAHPLLAGCCLVASAGLDAATPELLESNIPLAQAGADYALPLGTNDPDGDFVRIEPTLIPEWLVLERRLARRCGSRFAAVATRSSVLPRRAGIAFRFGSSARTAMPCSERLGWRYSGWLRPRKFDIPGWCGVLGVSQSSTRSSPISTRAGR